MIVGKVIRTAPAGKVVSEQATHAIAIIVEFTGGDAIDAVPVAEMEAAVNAALTTLADKKRLARRAQYLQDAGDIEVGRGADL